MRIRTKLILSFAFATLLPILFIGVTSFQQFKKTLTQNRIEELKTIADLKVEKIETFFEAQEANLIIARDSLNVRANLPILSEFVHDPQALEYLGAKQMLDRQLKSLQLNYDYFDVMLVGLDGKIAYTSNEAHASKDLGQALPDPGHEAFREGQRGLYFSEVFLNDREGGKISMLMTAPVYGFQEDLIGVIALEVDMAPIYEFIQNPIGLGKTGETLIGRKAGSSVLFLNPLRHDPATALRKSIPLGSPEALPIQEAVLGHQSSGLSRDYRNKEIIAVWRYISLLNWGLVAKIDTEEAFASVEALKHFLLIAIGLTLLAGAAISASIAKSITRPVQLLKDGIDIVSRGRLDYRVKVASRDEIGSLSAHLNTIFADIKKRNKDLNDFKMALDASSIVAITDQKGIIQYVNDKFCEISQYRRDELLGQDHRILNSGHHPASFIREMWTTIANGGVWQGIFKNKAKDGSYYWVNSTIVPILNEQGKPYQYLAVRNDITDQKNTEKEIRRMIHYDNLTGLPNRTLFNERLNQALKQRAWEKRPFAVMFLDLDRFKLINDSLGHAAGDTLLKEVSGRLTKCLRDDDTVARMGGDEFTLLLPVIAKKEDAFFVAQKINTVLKRPFLIAKEELFVTGSIGISIYPDDGKDVETLMKNADAAMYQAKENGRGQFTAFAPGILMEGKHDLSLTSALHHALERNEFCLHYQPLTDLRQGKIIGMEALIRWARPGSGLVPPGRFIPLVEETGLILPIGTWVLETAAKQLKSWEALGFQGLCVSVNVSALQFQQSDFPKRVEGLMKGLGLAAGTLKLEITESLLMRNQDKVITTLKVLKDIGVHFAIDDFGTGFSSLSYLRKFPLESLKVDRSFVMNLPENKDDAVIASTIITLGHQLGLKVTAEGIETQAQLAFLQARGCDVGQGYLFSRPIPAEDFTRLLKKDVPPESGPPEVETSRGKKPFDSLSLI